MDSLDWNLVRSFAAVAEHGSLSAAARASCQNRSYQIVLTHDQDEAIELADRIVILNQGMIEQVGTLSKS